MDDLNKMLGHDFNKCALQLLVNNSADLLMNRKLLIRIITNLEKVDESTINEEIDKSIPGLRKLVVDNLPKVLKS